MTFLLLLFSCSPAIDRPWTCQNRPPLDPMAWTCMNRK
jgi:hypothetical protein